MKRLSLLIYIIAATLGLSAQNTIEVAVLSINDFHGGFVRDDFKGIPGAASVVQTIDSLKQVYPCNIVVSAGDNFGGSYFYQATRSRTLFPQFFQDCGITLSGIGNHEFDEGQAQMMDCWKTGVSLRPAGWDMEYISANIRCDATSDMRTDGTSRPRFCKPYAVREISLPDGRKFSIAFIGLTTSSTPLQASASKLKGLSFCGDVCAVLDSLARTPGYDAVRQANARLILTHQGTRMKQVQRGTLTMVQPTWDDADSLNLTRLNDAQFAGIISSHSHQPVCGTINELPYPILQGCNCGKYIGVMKFTLDATTLEVVNVEPSLVPVTPKTQFTPKAARLQAQIDELLADTHTRAGTPIGDYLTTCRKDIPFDRVLMHHDQTRMGQLVTNAYAAAARQQEGFTADDLIVGVTHIGSMRCGLSAGPVRVLDIGEVLPFDNAMRVYKVTGRQLRELIDYGLHNERYGYLQFSHLTPTMDKKRHVKSLTYTHADGRQVKISDKATCYIVADEFLAGGGDGYDPALFPAAQEMQGLAMPHITDAFINYLKTQPEI